MDPTLRFQALSVKYGWVNFNANVSVSMGLPAPIKPSELVGIPRRTGAAPDENDIPANLPRFQRSLSTIRHSSSSNNEMTNSNPSETSSPPRSPSFTSPCVPPCPPQSSLRSSRRRVVLSYTESDSESPILAAASPSAGATSPPVPCTRARRTPGRRIIDSDDDNSVDNVFDAAVGSPADLPPVPVDEAGLSDDSFYSCKSAPKTRQPIAPPQDIISPDVPVPKRPESRTPATNRRRVVLTPTSSDSASSVDDSGCASRSNHELFIASEDEDNDIDCISIGSDSDVPSPPLVPLPTPSRTPSHKRPPAKNSKTPVAAVTPHTPFRGNGLAQRQQLTASAFREFNMRVFGDALPADLSVDWSARLRYGILLELIDMQSS